MSYAPAFDDYTPAGGGRVTAVLGPTNTGKTHYALERMLAHRSGMIGLPLRLLAREIYDRIVAMRGERMVALVTGEEKIIPPNPRYWVATVEAMPLEREVDFLAIDEVQLAADPERGRVFTSRLLYARGMSETLFLGSDTMRPILQRLFRNIQFLSRTRFSNLTYAGPKKVTRLPRRTAVVAFSSDMVYAIAELIRRQRGGAAVVLGALSPRTRNAQAELYQSGEVDFLVATDAIGMGLNMDIDHVAFAAGRKFDGVRPRKLTPAETAQIAGRAGRHVRDGTFGVTADCPPFDQDMVTAIEEHQFDPVTALQWRSEAVDLSSIPALLRSLEKPPPRPEFVRSRREDDEDALARLIQRDDIRDIARGGAALATLWEICQTPDFRKLSHDQHARLLGEVYLMLMRDGRINDKWLDPQVNSLDRTDGDIDAISARIAHIRTWTYLCHRSSWLQNAPYWQERTRAIEDKLSDALHEKLTQRFVDRRTATLQKRLKDNEPLLAGVTEDGEVIVEGQFVGRLLGFEFIVDPRASGAEAKSLRAAGEKALRPVLAARAAALANAAPDELKLTDHGEIWWRAAPVARLKKGPAPLRPEVVVSAIAEVTPNMRGRVEDRLKDFIAARIEGLLGPLITLQTAAGAEDEEALKGLSKGVAYRLVENFGATSRAQFGDDLKQIEQNERAKLRKIGMRFGEYTLFMPQLLKPAPAQLLILLWALWSDRNPTEAPPPKAGLVSLEVNESLPHAYYYAAGYRPSGKRAVRIDMLERLAGLIRTARNEAIMREGFEATPQMMSLVGCSGEDFEAIMRSLGLRKTTVKKSVIDAAIAAKAARAAEAAEKAARAKAEAEAAKAEAETAASAPTPEASAPPAAAAESQAPTEATMTSTHTATTDLTEAQAEETPTVATDASAALPAETLEATTETAVETPAPEEAAAAEASSAAETAPAEETPQQPATPEPPAEAGATLSAEDTAPSETDAPAEAAAEEVEDIDVALWRPAPRKTFSKPRRDAKHGEARQGEARRGEGRRNDDRKGGKPGPRGKGKKGDKFQKDRPAARHSSPMMHEPRHRRTADPDSPFAVLAGLKSQLSDDKEGRKNKETEKAE